jgi:hypothetical protein
MINFHSTVILFMSVETSPIMINFHSTVILFMSVETSPNITKRRYPNKNNLKQRRNNGKLLIGM